MEQNKINVLFVCGYGVGSSAISESIVKKALQALSIEAEVKHTAAGELASAKDWLDIIVISTKLAEGLVFDPGVHVIKVKNIMDGKGIAASIAEIVDLHYPQARTN